MNLPTQAAPTRPRVPRPHRPARSTGPLRRRPWLIAFVGFFLLCAGWALAAPYDGSPDEMEHIIRAAGVAQGEIAPAPTAANMGTGAVQHVPKSLVRDNCWMFHTDKSAACAQPPGGDTTKASVGTRAGRYNPVYYLVVGWPIALWPTMKGVLIGRLVSAALTAGFLAAAANAAVRWSRHRVMAAGVLIAVTPISVHLAGSINPNGLEISAAVALFSALVPLVLGTDTSVRRGAVVQVAVAGATLGTLRVLGPFWLVAIFGILLVPIARTRLAALARSRPIRWTIAALLAACALGAAWTVVMRASELGSVTHSTHLTTLQALRYEVVTRTSGYFDEMVGVPSWLDTPMPGWTYTVWDITLGAVLLPAFALGTWADRRRLTLIPAAALAVAIVPDALDVNSYGFVSQGRYILPLMVGLPILAAWLLGHRGVLQPAHGDKLTRWVAVVVLPLQLVFLDLTMVRWQSGLTYAPDRLPLNPLHGSWHPMVGSATALGAAVLGTCALAFWVRSATRPGSTPVPDGAEPATAHPQPSLA
ncbi:DUF2142 domain-containing protein [Kitasatospora sp. LaBMicrA B282]|uniref:DUF2142 domain-containing protein n=1 Tax=Kitasatospora sp. LaBMicrA B282 TaxID=3420949 RepID=UPI003D134047